MQHALLPLQCTCTGRGVRLESDAVAGMRSSSPVPRPHTSTRLATDIGPLHVTTETRSVTGLSLNLSFQVKIADQSVQVRIEGQDRAEPAVAVVVPLDEEVDGGLVVGRSAPGEADSASP